jgi:FixJ family two-component response regulator
MSRYRGSALRLTYERSVCVLMACSHMREADQVGRQLLEQHTGCLVTYLRVRDLVLNAPTGRVALVILATDDPPNVLRRTLDWLRHRWPRCPVTVVADGGCGETEMVAREGGASFLVRPVDHSEWSALVSHALGLSASPARSGGLVT